MSEMSAMLSLLATSPTLDRRPVSALEVVERGEDMAIPIRAAVPSSTPVQGVSNTIRTAVLPPSPTIHSGERYTR